MPDTSLATQTTLDLLVSSRQKLVATQKAIDTELKRVNEEIKDELIAQDADSVDVGEFRVTISVRERASLDKKALVELGVSTETIAKATKTSTFTQLDVREREE